MKKTNRRLLMLAAPFVAGFLLFYVLPLFRSIWYSLVNNTVEQEFVGLKNYIDTMRNENFLLSVKNTMEILVLGVPPVVLFSLLCALVVQHIGEKMPLLRIALVLPMLLPSASVAGVFEKMGIESSRLTLIVIYIWKNAGFLMLIFLAALSTVPKELHEAFALDSASRVKAFWYITLPLIMGTMLFTVMLAIAYNLRLFREAYLLYGAYPDKTLYLMQHYMNNHFNKLNYQKLTTAATLFLVLLLAIIGCFMGLVRKFGKGSDLR
ncbi:MAG: sugar ABC transporter permease [Clostridiales bacterium]|nr:sugar ABC transporter permease [Clostridiales bacterium]